VPSQLVSNVIAELVVVVAGFLIPFTEKIIVEVPVNEPEMKFETVTTYPERAQLAVPKKL
jgi:hypothetical protein